MAEIATKIGQTAEWGWGVVLKQQVAYGIIGVFVSIISLTLLIRFHKWVVREEAFNDDGGEALILVYFFLFVFFVGPAISAILHLFNPEFYAIQFFINLVG